MYYVVSILFGLIPEVLYFTLFLIYTKNIKEKRIKLFIAISIAYFACLLIQRFKLMYYLAFVVLTYIILKLLYKNKTQITDIFVFSISTFYLTIISYICFLFLKDDKSNYYLFYLLDRIIMFIPFIFKNKFNILYKKYYRLWNRNDKENRPIKSITLRNISLIVINFIIVFMNIYMTLII